MVFIFELHLVASVCSQCLGRGSKAYFPRQILHTQIASPLVQIQGCVEIILSSSFWRLLQIKGYVAWVCGNFLGTIGVRSLATGEGICAIQWHSSFLFWFLGSWYTIIIKPKSTSIFWRQGSLNRLGIRHSLVCRVLHNEGSPASTPQRPAGCLRKALVDLEISGERQRIFLKYGTHPEPQVYRVLGTSTIRNIQQVPPNPDSDISQFCFIFDMVSAIMPFLRICISLDMVLVASNLHHGSYPETTSFDFERPNMDHLLGGVGQAQRADELNVSPMWFGQLTWRDCISICVYTYIVVSLFNSSNTQ